MVLLQLVFRLYTPQTGQFPISQKCSSVKDGALGRVSFVGRGNAIGARDWDDSGLPRKDGCYPGMTAAKFSVRNAIGGPVETCGPLSRRTRHEERRRFTALSRRPGIGRGDPLGEFLHILWRPPFSCLTNHLRCPLTASQRHVHSVR